ncbi:DUF4190 domain-containing protein [Catelliglobosispora koreensis]|uniref:DUF4190 domain-containing protein n=1 Tax=Catelliglobosispora koreensis TaxID=129052 RepID=UPI000A00024E|nr:DUF4190 domain-containing protein [Catelliglobosispora koreensis]
MSRGGQRTNGLAIAALVLGIVAVFPLAIILGLVALRQIKKRNDHGKGIAIAGIMLGMVWLGMCAAFGSFVVEAIRDFQPEVALDKGVCLTDVSGGDISMSQPVDCDEPHDAEVFALFKLTGHEQSEDEIRDKAYERCAQLFKLDVADQFQRDPLVVQTVVAPEPGVDFGFCLAEHVDSGGLTQSVLK